METNDYKGIEIKEKIYKLDGTIKTRKYYKNKLLGKGGFSECYEFFCPEKNKKLAAKIISKNEIDKCDKGKIINEVIIHKLLHHENIVSFEHYFEDEDNIYILLELCTKQTMRQLLKKKERLTEIEVKYYIIQLIKALRYLHFNNIIHCDLKLRNLFLTDNMILKLGDFGLASFLNKNEKKKTACGTPPYMAPEKINDENGYSFEADIWSLGVIIYILIIGEYPFDSEDEFELYKKIKKIDYTFPEDIQISESAKDLIKQILVFYPNNRPSLEQILMHDFFKQKIDISNIDYKPDFDYINKFKPKVKKGKFQLNQIECDNPPLEKSYETKTNSNWNYDEKLMPPEIWVVFWKIDNYNKYLGYLLNNGIYGVFFYDDDSTILLPSQSFYIYYISITSNIKKCDIEYYKLEEYPDKLKNKIYILNNLKNNFEKEINNNKFLKEKNMDNNNIMRNEKERKINATYMRQFIRTRDEIIFIFGNGVVQTIFKDHSEIIISSGCKFVTYINKKRKWMIYPAGIALGLSNYDMVSRLKYTKNIVTKILNESIKEKKKENKNKDFESINNGFKIQSNEKLFNEY